MTKQELIELNSAKANIKYLILDISRELNKSLDELQSTPLQDINSKIKKTRVNATDKLDYLNKKIQEELIWESAEEKTEGESKILL